jgi:hypothetical protein
VIQSWGVIQIRRLVVTVIKQPTNPEIFNNFNRYEIIPKSFIIDRFPITILRDVRDTVP